jgi:hypothetical protein
MMFVMMSWARELLRLFRFVFVISQDLASHVLQLFLSRTEIDADVLQPLPLHEFLRPARLSSASSSVSENSIARLIAHSSITSVLVLPHRSTPR